MRKHLTVGRIACYLLLLAAACALVFGTSYARFSSEAMGSGTASVAAAALNSRMDMSDRLEGIAPGETRTIAFQVTNQKEDGTISEVTQSYTITIETTGNLPLTYALSTGDTPDTDHALTNKRDALMWEGGILPHSVPATHTYMLSVSWPTGSASPYLADEIDLVAVTIDAQQVVN